MSHDKQVAAHYAFGDIIALIRDGLAKIGKTPETVTTEDLAGMDEFHIGGAKATGELLAQLGLSPQTRMLDVGCGMGGACRVAAGQFGARVTGLDLTPEYVATARELSRWLGFGERIEFHAASALAMPFADKTFDVATMLHAGMNIADKKALCAEVARVLKPGGKFGIYDVMRVGEGGLAYPVPWAKTPATSALDTPAAYKAALAAAGFKVIHERNRADFAIAHFDMLMARLAAAGGPPPLGQHLLMGELRPQMVKNMMANVKAGLIAPVEMIAVLG